MKTILNNLWSVKLRRIYTVALFSLLVVGLLMAFMMEHQTPAASSVVPAKKVAPISSAILRENALPGTSNWQLSPDQIAYNEIQMYTDTPSVLPNQTISFYVSTQKEGTAYTIDIYRLGWYGGMGGRLVDELDNLKGSAQGYYDQHSQTLVNCSSCIVDSKTGLVEAHWQPSYTLTIPPGWLSGIYLAKCTDASGLQTYVSFVVRSLTPTLYIAVNPDTSYQAYNNWGGYSLYDYNSLSNNGLHSAVKVSFDRPYTDVLGAGGTLTFELDALHWLEREGYDISYISNVDLQRDPGQLLHYRAYLSLGHDEYWTKEMRDGVENARNHGVSLAFLGANADYWQMRFESDSKGVPDRTIVCYKVATAQHDLQRDPFYGVDNSRVTAQWRDPVIGRPENSLIGIMYANVIHQRRGYPWYINPQTASPLLRGTGLQPSKSYGCDLVGYEWDRVFTNGATPANLQVLAVSPVTNDDGTIDVSYTTYYFANAKSLVFASGSVYWTGALDDYRISTNDPCAGQTAAIPAIQKLMTNVMDALVNPAFYR
ncbi:MAG TPA: N,N-dimethylformamidase beta subunit family domain-containing protein [Ktedonobacteraceae bacterium]|nr:N,N-dimethylformamidase beta subunit family domain-containing protein [Ktedonobacteraceae bacterium]